jgi:hypothetical protein
VRKTLLKRGDLPVGEYIFVRLGTFEAEAEYDLEEQILY